MTFDSLPTPVYIAGPISGHDDLNWPAFRAVERAVVTAIDASDPPPMSGMTVSLVRCGVPHRIDRIVSLTTGELLPEAHPDRIACDDEAGFACSVIWMLHNAESVVLLPGYADSRGTVAEIAVALRLGVPVFEVVYEDGAPVGVRPLTLRVSVVDCTSDAAHSGNCDTAPVHRNL